MAILVGTGVASIALIVAVILLFSLVFIPFLQFGGKGEIPSDFPVYPGAHLESAFATGSNGCSVVEASWSTRDGEARVVAFYREQLNTGPWKVTDYRPGTSGDVISFANASGPQRQGDVDVASGPFSGTVFSLQLAKSTGAANTRCLFGQVGD